MNGFELPIVVIYVGLGATLLALLVATIVNRWSPKVFFLLALRLAIGWQFLFEGAVQSPIALWGQPAESARPFSSEPYFRAVWAQSADTCGDSSAILPRPLRRQ